MASPSDPEDGPSRKVDALSSTTTASTRAVANHRKYFPQILMEVLNRTSSDPNIAEILAWNDDGTSFRILSRQGLEEIVMPQYFATLPGNKATSSAKYASFTRKLNRWGFRRITAKGPDMGNFHHYQFRRDEPELIALMECTKRRYGSRIEGDTQGIPSSAGTGGGVTAASSYPSSAPWNSSYPGMGTLLAPGYMHMHAPPHTEYAHRRGRTISDALGVASGGHVVSGSGQTYSNHHPGHHAVGHNRVAMAAAEAHHWSSAGMPGIIHPPPNPNFLGAANRHDGPHIGGGNAGSGDSAMYQQPPPSMGYHHAAVSGVGPGQHQLVNEVHHHTSLDTAYLSNLEIMAMARRDRAILQYRNAAGLRLDQPPVQDKKEDGRVQNSDGDTCNQKKDEKSPDHKREDTEHSRVTEAESVPENALAAATSPSEERSEGTK